MLTTQATPEMLKAWKATWEVYKDRLPADRRSGQELLDCLRVRYPLEPVNTKRSNDVVSLNVLENKPYSDKLPPGETPRPVTFYIKNEGGGRRLYDSQDEAWRGEKIFVGIDLASGFYLVEGSSLLWDELCAFQGLDELDLENCFCVAQYIECLERFGMDIPCKENK